MTRTLLCAAMLLSGAAAHAQTPGEVLAAAQKVNPRIFSAGDDPYPDHRVDFAGGVTGLPDVTYAIVAGYRPLKLDLYLPPAAFAGPRPVVVFIHGGGWVGGGPRLSAAFDNWPAVLAAVAARGYVVAAVGYRFSGEAPSPAAIRDVKSAIRWLRANAVKYRVDKDRFVTWGGSAGGQLAALTATSCGVQALEPPAPSAPTNANVERPTAGTAPPQGESSCVQGAVAWYGIFDFATMPGRATERAYLGCGEGPCSTAQFAQPSATTYLGRETPPMLVIAGTEDRTVPPQQSRDFFAAMQAHGVGGRC